MASEKRYAYYMKGNKIAIVQQESNTLGNNLSEYGKYKSPIDTVDRGLRIEYSYSPIYDNFYNVDVGATATANINGYSSYKGNLIIFATNRDFAHSTYNTLYPVGGHIILNHGGVWNGLHKIKERWAHALVLETKLPTGTFYYSDGWTPSDAETFTKGGSNVNQHISVGDWIGVAENSASGLDDNHEGFFKVSAVTNTVITVSNYVEAVFDATTGTMSHTEPAAVLPADTGDRPHVFKAKKDLYFCTPLPDLMDDESFDISLSRYQSNALVYYLKARVAEDMMDLETKEYYMREFKRCLEKYSSSRNTGAIRVQGFWGMRK